MSTMSSRARGRLVTVALIGLVVLLVALPLLFKPTAKFGGSDAAASAAISELQPGYQPWANPLWQPPSGEIESLLFALQAAIGAGAIGYFFGLKRGQRLAEHAARRAEPGQE